MPVRKFRSIEEMKAPWRSPDDPGLTEAIRRLWDLGRRLVPRRFPAGVHRHRTIEDLWAQEEAWEAESFRARAAPRDP